MMKRVLFATAAAFVAGPAMAGGYAEPIYEPQVIVDNSFSGITEELRDCKIPIYGKNGDILYYNEELDCRGPREREDRPFMGVTLDPKPEKTKTPDVDREDPEDRDLPRETPEQPEQPENPEQPEQPENPEQPEQPENPEQPEQPKKDKPKNNASEHNGKGGNDGKGGKDRDGSKNSDKGKKRK